MTTTRKGTRARVKRARTVVWTARAERDLEVIGDFIARDKPLAARRFVLRLAAAGERAGKMPLAGRRVPEIQRDEIREVLLGAYRIVYHVTDDRVSILTVFEGHQLLKRERIPDED